MKITTKWITLTAMLTALVIVSGYIPKMPTPLGNIYWCDGPIIISAILLDPIGAFIAGGVSMLLYDLLVGSAMAVPSLIIHGLQAAVISLIVHYVFPQKDNIIKALIACLVGAIIVVAGYFICRACIPFLYADAGLPLALAKMPANFIQEGVGITIALVILYVFRLKAILKKSNLLPQSIFSK